MKENIRRAILQDQDIYLCVPMRDASTTKFPKTRSVPSGTPRTSWKDTTARLLRPRRICRICLTR